jgi:hypothetical protein
MSKEMLEMRIRALLVFFMVALVLSGLSAIPLEWGSTLLAQWFGTGTWFSTFWPEMSQWIVRVHNGAMETGKLYPFLFYGNDWLAFGHVAIAISFIGPLRDPVKNIWVIEFGMITCLLVVPWALIFIPLRGVPLFWWPIDSAFGILGILPLWLARKYTLKLARL